MNKKDFCAITFPSTHLALRWETLAKKENLEVKIIPVPRQISSSCGLAGKFACGELEKVLRFCTEKTIDFENIYRFPSGKKGKPELLK